ncbi:MAG: hypothetical protein P1U53_07935 [Sulfitobacter sp.]|nr:hypothetical protein [Sulfitobacter sp.]
MALTSVILLVLMGTLALRAPLSFLTRNMEVPPAVVALHGSGKAGQALLQGGYSVRWESGWRWALLPHLRTELVLEGADTRVSGWLESGPQGLALKGLEGRAGPGLAKLVPGAWDCPMTASLSDISFRWGWRRITAAGQITVPQGTCTRNGREAEIPPLRADLSHADGAAKIVLSAVQGAELAQARISRERVIDLTIQPAAADIFPALPRSGPIALQLPF